MYVQHLYTLKTL